MAVGTSHNRIAYFDHVRCMVAVTKQYEKERLSLFYIKVASSRE